MDSVRVWRKKGGFVEKTIQSKKNQSTEMFIDNEATIKNSETKSLRVVIIKDDMKAKKEKK